MTIRLAFESLVAAQTEAVWARVSTMAGVNAELMPLVRMTHPREYRGRSIAEAPVGPVLFHSWLLLGGILPIDRHALALVRLLPGEGFDEDSTSWLQRRWRHRRRVESVGEGTRIVDVLEFEPRIAAFGALVKPIVNAIFAHRHRRLRRAFGTLTPA